MVDSSRSEVVRSASRPPRAERLEARISREQKELFRRAATLQGRTLTDFVVTSLQEVATRTLRDHETMSLGPRDSEAFVAALLESPEPGERLKAAYRRYRQAMASE